MSSPEAAPARTTFSSKSWSFHIGNWYGGARAAPCSDTSHVVLRMYSRLRRAPREVLACGLVVEVRRADLLCALVSSWLRAWVACVSADCTRAVHVEAASDLRCLAVSSMYVGRCVGRASLAWLDGRSDGWLERRMGERTTIVIRVMKGMRVNPDLNWFRLEWEPTWSEPHQLHWKPSWTERASAQFTVELNCGESRNEVSIDWTELRLAEPRWYALRDDLFWEPH